MKVTAYTYRGVWREWIDVARWRLEPPYLRIAAEGDGFEPRRQVLLPPEVIGLADDRSSAPPIRDA